MNHKWKLYASIASIGFMLVALVGFLAVYYTLSLPEAKTDSSLVPSEIAYSDDGRVAIVKVPTQLGTYQSYMKIGTVEAEELANDVSKVLAKGYVYRFAIYADTGMGKEFAFAAYLVFEKPEGY